MKRVVLSLLAGIAGYVVGAMAGYLIINQFSANSHDRSVEAAMTAAFVTGPLCALVAFGIAIVTLRKKPSPTVCLVAVPPAASGHGSNDPARGA